MGCRGSKTEDTTEQPWLVSLDLEKAVGATVEEEILQGSVETLVFF